MKRPLVSTKTLKRVAPGVWLSAAAVSMCLLMVFLLIGLIALRGLDYFAPHSIHIFTIKEPAGPTKRIVGQLITQETSPRAATKSRYLISYNPAQSARTDYLWVNEEEIVERVVDKKLAVIRRLSAGPVYAYLNQAEKQNLALYLHQIGEQQNTIRKMREKQLKPLLNTLSRAQGERQSQLQAEIEQLQKALAIEQQALRQNKLNVRLLSGQMHQIEADTIETIYYPNDMSLWEKAQFFVQRLIQFVVENPREANTQGGVYPAIFGTVLLVFIMTLFVAPMGVIAALYLHEYAGQNLVTRLIRIAVINLAGIPSIVYGVFGLGFFVYFIGGNIDQLFYAQTLPAPTFGSPGILWSALTLAILTLPIVIVTTEEGLSRIPKSMREGSYALGANRSETICRVILPMATPAILTGLILSISRAAGEVAPLMLVGVVKLAQNLPIDGQFPYLHLDRQFMHLGFHIYDLGFQSSHAEVVRPTVYATAFLLLSIVVFLNLAAISLRNRLYNKYKQLNQY